MGNSPTQRIVLFRTKAYQDFLSPDSDPRQILDCRTAKKWIFDQFR